MRLKLDENLGLTWVSLLRAVERLTEALASAELAGHLWVINASRVRQYQPPGS